MYSRGYNITANLILTALQYRHTTAIFQRFQATRMHDVSIAQFRLMGPNLVAQSTSNIWPQLHSEQVQGSAKRRAPGCVNASGKARQK